MFETLTDRLQGIFQNLGRRGKLRPQDVDQALAELRMALLEADVHHQVVGSMLGSVRRRALGELTARSIHPAQHVLRILHEELLAALGEPQPLELRGPRPRAVMLVGLQGSGKTTTAAKLAQWLRARGERPWLVAADPYRPAAGEQLQVLAEQLQVGVFHQSGKSADELARQGIAAGTSGGASVVLLDTAGRSQLDQELMQELRALKQQIQPAETLLVADAMTGQQAVSIADGFHSALELSGLILSKMDGDARGGAAISMRSITGVPIKFIGTGERVEDLEPFAPDRLATRILGMGDLTSLLENVEAQLDQVQAEAQAKRMIKGDFTLEDFADQLAQVRRMGPLHKVLGMLPQAMTGGVQLKAEDAEQRLIRTQAIIQSMTFQERRSPDILNASRKRRVAAGSGTSVQEINQLLRQYRQMRRMLRQFGNRGLANLPF